MCSCMHHRNLHKSQKQYLYDLRVCRYSCYTRHTERLMMPTSCAAINYNWGYGDIITHAHTHPFNGPLFGTTRVSRYQKGKTNLDFTEARNSEWQWHQLDHMQTICTLLQTDNHTNTSPLNFLQARCSS